MLFKYNNFVIKPAFIFLAVFFAGACGKGIVPTSTAVRSQVAPPASEMDMDFAERPQVLSGWLDTYTIAVETTVSSKYPELLNLSPKRLGVVCPAWDRLTNREREAFWSSLVWSIAGPESGYRRTAIFRETSLPIDKVTGRQIRSEGLLQLSYVDVVNYRYPGKDVSWIQDRVAALADYTKGVSSGNPKRTLLDAYANLNLGLWIMYRQLTAIHATQPLETALGHYWATMRTSGSGFPRVLANLRKRAPNCF